MADTSFQESSVITDNMSTHSDTSVHTALQQPVAPPGMDAAVVIDLQQVEHLAPRKRAWEEVQQACALVNANEHHIQFEKLDFGETNILDTFYNADVAIVDLSIQVQQSALVYHLGVRESFGMRQNILLVHDNNTEATLRLKISCDSYILVPYKLLESGSCIATDPTRLNSEDGQVEAIVPLSMRLKKLMQEVQVETKAHMKEKFLSDLRKTRETLSGDELAAALRTLCKRLDDPNVLSGEVVLNVLISYREIQDYDAMVQLVDQLRTIPTKKKYVSTSAINYLYAFALNRRNKEGDRDKALYVMEKALEKKENHIPDILCLCGRIYKDRFVESSHEDKESLKNAIHWYRKGFEVQPNEYAGINLATLLVIDGNEFSMSEELQHVGMVLNNLIGKKGSLSSLQDYWDVATFFEISVLAEDYAKAIQASECMFKLKPPNWYLKSTIGNITLIDRFRKKKEDVSCPEQEVFTFWMEFFYEATLTEVDESSIRFPMLVLEPSKVLMPSYITVNLEAEEKSIQITNICLDCRERKCRKVHEWVFTASQIRSVSLYKRDERCLFLYVHENCDDFQCFLPSVLCRERLHHLILEMTADQEGMVTDLDADLAKDKLDYEYELDEHGKRIMLGKGTYGVVYVARDKSRQVKIAVKEIPEKNLGDVQPLHEEIRLHSQLRHRNIVQYLGSASEDGYFKIFMEQVPGGSLSALLQSKWGPLKSNETAIVYYTRQILQGLKYLHDQKIVHRDIKGDNVLVNTYSGVVKISDFGTSKRLAGLCPRTETFTGTFQYMAPEVIDKGQRGYGAAADIWSLGCTVVEMATGKPPFTELGSAQAAVFKVGFYKMHPNIPSELSHKARVFIERCFEPLPEKRATAPELLEDDFLSEKKKSLSIAKDFSRSISVPIDRMPKFDKQTSASSMRTPESPDEIHTLTLSEIDGGISLSRRNSSGTPLSPEGDCGQLVGRGTCGSPCPMGTADTPSEQDGFYLLKKDSQRRMTLCKVLVNDEAKVCEVWMESLQQGVDDPALTMAHLKTLMGGLRACISEINKEELDRCIRGLKEELEYDHTAMNQMLLAIYHFQDAVNVVLKTHSIKPHWMFALDNLVRSAVQTAITILSPELGANLAGQDGWASQAAHAITLPQPIRSTTSTANSFKSQKTATSEASLAKFPLADLQEQMDQVLTENIAMLKRLIDSQRAYQELMARALDDVKGQVMSLQSSVDQLKRRRPVQNDVNPSRRLAPQATHDSPVDAAMVKWLLDLGLDQPSVNRFVDEELCLEDLLVYVTRADLAKLDLRMGLELRVWKAILKSRSAS